MRRGSCHSIETIRQIGKANRGRHHTKEELAKMRLAGFKRKQSLETRAKISQTHLGPKNPNYGKHLSAETRRKLSLSHTGARNHQWGKPIPKEVRAKISASLKGKNHPNYGKSRDDETVRKIIQSNRLKPNKAELHLQSILNIQFPNQWKFVGNGEVIIGGLCPDFVNVNNEKTLLELYGSYWHSEKMLRNWKSTELGRIMLYNSYGFKCLIIWEKELNNEEALIRKIETYGTHKQAQRLSAKKATQGIPEASPATEAPGCPRVLRHQEGHIQEGASGEDGGLPSPVL